MRTSICSRTRCFDRPSPFIDLALDEIAQVFGRPALGSNQIDPHLVEPGAYSRRIHRLDRGIVQLLDDRQRRTLRQEEGAPIGYIDVGNADEKIFRRLPLSLPCWALRLCAWPWSDRRLLPCWSRPPAADRILAAIVRLAQAR